MDSLQHQKQQKPLLALKGVGKSFGKHQVVFPLDLSITTPCCLALLGLNGAGKTTLLRMITGNLPCDTGTISICGEDLATRPMQAKQHLGYLPENAPSYPGMRVKEILSFLGRLYAIESPEERISETMAQCGLQEVANCLTEELSKGYRHRLGIAQAILHHPEVIILDEPTDGLDPIQKTAIRLLLKKLGEKNLVVISTHILEDVEIFCNQTAILEQGRLKYIGDVPKDINLKP